MPPVPAKPEDLAFLPVTRLARLMRDRRVKSVDLTRLYLERLRKLDPVLHAVISYTEERAMEEAERADRELDAGNWRGPLHGIPWGAKDLLAARGARTTWGSVPFKEQVIDQDATVVERLEKAGAVLIAKLTLGELAWGDVWFGGMTRNPWNLEQGSSGSSAGSAAATSAGAVGFTIGSETLGSIVSPCTRTGATGLRPTFGRVSRHGAMALSWSMDKLGPICRSVEDCAAVFHAIHGPDGQDLTVVDAPFRWDPELHPRRLRVGYLKSLFEAKPDEGQEEWHAFNQATLEVLRRDLRIELKPIELPAMPIDALSVILGAESAAAFDELTRERQGRPAGAADRERLAELLAPGADDPGRLLHPGQPRSDPGDAGDGTDPGGHRRLRLPDLRRQQPAADQPDRPPGRGGAERFPQGRHSDQHHLHRQPVQGSGGDGGRPRLPGPDGFPPAPSQTGGPGSDPGLPAAAEEGLAARSRARWIAPFSFLAG